MEAVMSVVWMEALWVAQVMVEEEVEALALARWAELAEARAVVKVVALAKAAVAVRAPVGGLVVTKVAVAPMARAGALAVTVALADPEAAPVLMWPLARSLCGCSSHR